MKAVTIRSGNNVNYSDREWASFDVIYLESADDFFSFISSDAMNKIRNDAEVIFEH